MNLSQNNRRNNILQACLNSLGQCIELIDEHYPADEKEHALTVIRQLTKKYHEDETKCDLSRNALKLTEDYFNTENCNHENINEIYDKNVKDSVACVISMEEHPTMKPIIDALNINNRPGTSQISNDSLVYTQTSHAFIDPITKCGIQNPRKNKVCGHVYEYSAIVNYIDCKKSKSKCPYVGCVNTKMRKSDLIEDKHLSTQIITSQSNSSILEGSIEQIDDSIG